MVTVAAVVAVDSAAFVVAVFAVPLAVVAVVAVAISITVAYYCCC